MNKSHYGRFNQDIDEINNLFNKKFQFRFQKEWILPGPDKLFREPPWTVKDLHDLKDRLNFHKSQLNNFNIEEWSKHTRQRNPAGEVCWRIKNTINPEFLTQAWTKFYECAYTYNVVPIQAENEKQLVSLHLCEAPGAFITSFNHYLKCHHRNIKWQWLASTLNPYYEGNSPSNMINDDRFMFHTLDNWDFGPDNTGNLMLWENSQALVKKAMSLGKVLLVTADGSIDCLQKPDAQEEVTSPLHYCEIVTALQCLSEGGTLVFKLFTLFEHSTVCLMFLINHLFDEVNVYKPVTSRQGNSEVYAICLRYKGYHHLEPYLPVLKSAFGTELYSNAALFPLESIPTEFLKQIEECAYYFCSIQCDIINRNLQAYFVQRNSAFNMDMKRIKGLVATTFLKEYDLRTIVYEDEILKGLLHNDAPKLNTNPRYHRGSYSERQLYTGMSLKEKSEYLMGLFKSDILPNILIYLNEPVLRITLYEESYLLKLKFTYGKPVERIHSSKYIFLPIFKLYLQILAEKEFRDLLMTRVRPQRNCSEFDPCTTIDFQQYDHSESYWIYEKRSFKKLCDCLKKLSIGDNILLRNYVTLTHFNISILFILGKKCFEKIAFTDNGVIVLVNLLDKSAFKYLDIILNECGCKEMDVSSALPVQVTNTDGLFNSLVYYNNTLYRNKCLEYLCTIDEYYK